MTEDVRYFEDVAAGETARSGPVTVAREAMLAFARAYDPQSFHLDEAAGAASPLGGLAASGWHTAALGMRLLFDGWVRDVASMGAPGIDELRWLRPVRAGDRIAARITVEETRASGSRPDRGFARMLLDLRVADESVMTQRFSVILQRRGTTQAPGTSTSGTASTPEAASAPGAAPASEPAAVAVPAVAASVDATLGGFYEDLSVGHRVELGRQTFAPEMITTFATLFDPQYFHLDAEAARFSHFGGLVASGWQTAAFWMKHYVAARARAARGRRAAGLPVSADGPSPGFDDLKWLRPVRAGETIAYALTISAKRPSRRPGWGLVLTEGTGHTLEGTLVFSLVARVLWPMRSNEPS